MAQTYEQYVTDVRADIVSEGYEQDIALYFDIAESLLFFAEFKALAQQRFPVCRTESALKEAVAHSLY